MFQKVFSILLTESSNASDHCLREIEQALMLKKEILPLRIGQFELSDSMEFCLRTHHWMEFPSLEAKETHMSVVAVIRERLEGTIAGLAQSIADIPTETGTAAQSPPQKKSTSGCSRRGRASGKLNAIESMRPPPFKLL